MLAASPALVVIALAGAGPRVVLQLSASVILAINIGACAGLATARLHTTPPALRRLMLGYAAMCSLCLLFFGIFCVGDAVAPRLHPAERLPHLAGAALLAAIGWLIGLCI